jgi:hypothetical protein
MVCSGELRTRRVATTGENHIKERRVGEGQEHHRSLRMDGILEPAYDDSLYIRCPATRKEVENVLQIQTGH